MWTCTCPSTCARIVRDGVRMIHMFMTVVIPELPNQQLVSLKFVHSSQR